MKTLKALFMIGATIFTLYSCSNDDTVTSSKILTDTESQDIIEESLTQNNAGLVLELDVLSGEIDGVFDLTTPMNSGGFADSLTDFCGETQAKTKAGSYDGPNRSWNYDYAWSRTLVCDGNNRPQYFDVIWDAERNFQNQLVTSSAVAYGDWTVHFTNDQYVIKIYNGDYTRNIERNAVNSDRFKIIELETNIVDVEVRRADKFILDGRLNFTIAGENHTGNTFSRSGEVKFNGDCTATITMDNGNSRTVVIC